MPSNTPLPAAQLLKLADELLAASSECNGGTLWRVDEWSRLQLAEEAYRAARAASPVTLEEALLEEAELIIQHLISDEDCGCHCQTQWGAGDCGLCKAWKFINARRLAGEGGGK